MYAQKSVSVAGITVEELDIEIIDLEPLEASTTEDDIDAVQELESLAA